MTTTNKRVDEQAHAKNDAVERATVGVACLHSKVVVGPIKGHCYGYGCMLVAHGKGKGND